MLQSNALLLLIVGLAGICQVATFGTMPGSLKGLTASTRGETAGKVQDTDVVHDPDFCINLPAKQSTGPIITFSWGESGGMYCNDFAKTEAACGNGTTLYRLSSGGKNKYDPCFWDKDHNGGAGKCKMSGDVYNCGDQCFPTAQTPESTTTGAPAGKKIVSCGGLDKMVDSTVHDTTCKCIKVADPYPIIKTRCSFINQQIVSTQSGRRLMTSEEFTTDCYSRNKYSAPVPYDASNPNGLLVQDVKDCKPSTDAQGTMTCTCEDKQVMTLADSLIPGGEKTSTQIYNDNGNTLEAATNDECRDVSPCFWANTDNTC